MTTADIVVKIEQLSEALVMADPMDLPALAAIHTQLEEIQAWAKAQGLVRTLGATKGAADLVETVILSEAPDPAGALIIVGELAAALQGIAGDNRPEGDAVFPAALEPGGNPAGQYGAKAGGGVTLPSFIDEVIFSEFLTRQDGVLEEMEALLLRVEQDKDVQAMGEVRRQLHTLKGESALLGLTDVELLCHTAEDMLSGAETPVMTDTLLSLKDWLKRAFDGYSGKGEPCEAPDALLAQLRGQAAVTASPAAQGLVTRPPTLPEAMVAEEPELHFEPKPLEGDKSLMGDFVQEAMEHLENSDLHLLTLETDPTNTDAINAVFRAFHTIKGVAGFMALDEIQALAHEAENLLDQVRKEALELSGKTIDVVFEAVDAMKRCIGNVSHALAADDLLAPVAELPGLVRQIKAIARGKVPAEAPPAAARGASPERKLGEILIDSGVATEAAVTEALVQQRMPATSKKLGEILAEGNVVSSRDVKRALEIQQQTPAKRLGEVLVDTGAATPEEVAAALAHQSKPPEPVKLGEALVRAGDADAQEVAQALRAQRNPAGGGGAGMQMRDAVKVDADRLDQLVDMIGELVIAESMVAQSPEMQRYRAADLGRQVSQLDKITRELQVMAMSLRMVPIRSTFQKMARLVRDLAKKTDKPVEFHMSGEETELDKTVVDKIGDPLVHMVRNAVDHGLEDSVETRLKAGKPATGNVYLRAFHAGGNIHVEVEDDGRGLNRDAILKKAIERGLVSASDTLSDREVWNLIFEPGFSTAQQVTAVSGRGVGMDVVKRNIDALRGNVEIVSQLGKGCVFTIRLPLTLAIIDGMVVSVGAERYVLPTLSIVISLRPTPKEINTVVGRGELLSLQGHLLPLFRLYRTFGLSDARENPCEGTVVVVENNGNRVGLLVDEILGQQQIVIKSLGESFRGLPGIAGGAIMPDGRVGLILDVGGLVRLATESVES